MNRLEKHIHDNPRAARFLNFDACQVQFILRSELPKPIGECVAAAVALKMARHFARHTFLGYHDSLRRRRDPLNPQLTQRLQLHVWHKLRPIAFEDFSEAVGRYH